MSLPLSRPPETLCLLRLSAIGDCTHMLPIVHTLQTHWPHTHLSWIVGKTEAELVGDLPGVEFIVFDKNAGPTAYGRLWRELIRRRFDVALKMQVAGRANLAGLAIRAPIRLGFDSARAKDGHGLGINCRIPPTPDQHVLDGFFSFLETLGLRERVMSWELPIPPQAEAFAERHIPDDTPTLVISPCSSHPRRDWDAESYAGVADHAIERHGLQVLLSGGPSSREKATAQEIASQMRHEPINLVGKQTLKGLFAIMRRAVAVITPDSGPAHIATAAGAPVIGLYAASNPQRTGPYLSRQWCVNRYPEAARRFLGADASALPWGQKIKHPQAMSLIHLEDVIERLDALMAAGGRRAIDDAGARKAPNQPPS